MKLAPISLLGIALVLPTFVHAFPFLADKFAASPLSRSPNPIPPHGPLPNPLTRRGAEPYDPRFPYAGAKIDGLPGTGIGGFQVPSPGDTAHQYQDPPPGAVRGPCPGMNAAANHGFISRDGITTFNEIIAAQQNIWNVGWDLAVFLAANAITDGDALTGKLSIGGDRTLQTAGPLGALLGSEPGLNGHNKFETDASLTRNDYYLANGDDYTFNGTLFKMMIDTVASTSSVADPLFDFKGLALYRAQRYDQSRADNGNFYYGDKQLLIYGATSFLYTLYPSSKNDYKPDLATMEPFFGAKPDGHGGYTHVPERIPDNWYNRETPYTLLDIVTQLSLMYLAYPKPFGGNLGKGNFNGINLAWNGETGAAGACLVQQALFEDAPGATQFSDLPKLPLPILQTIATQFGKAFGPLGCPPVM